MAPLADRAPMHPAEIAEQFRDWERSKSPYLWQRRIEVVLPHLPGQGRVLDAGCGDRTVIERLARTRPDLDFVGADLREMTPGPGLVRADCQLLPFADASFDCVLMLAVIEHVPDQLASLAEAHRVLRADGTVLITTPNPLYAAPNAIAARLGLKYREGYDNSVSLDRLASMAVDAGLEVVETRRFLLLPFASPLAELDRLVDSVPLARRLLLNQFLKARRP